MLSNLFVICVIAYIGFGALLYFKQRDLMYLPTPDIAHPYSEKEFLNENETIKVVVLDEQQPNAILYFGGNGEAVERNAENFLQTFPGFAIYLVKYRGYGGSSGSPTERAIYSDAEYIFEQLETKYKTISVIGRSLGSGVATMLAAKKNVEKLVLVTPFDSAESVARQRYPIFPISWLLKDKYDSLSRVAAIRKPTLIIIAEQDRVINKDHALRLASEFPLAQISVEMLANTGHNNLDNNSKYFDAMYRFFKDES